MYYREVFFVVAVISLLAWTMNIEYRIATGFREHIHIQDRLSVLEREINKGILPLAQERLERMAKAIASIENGLQDFKASQDRFEVTLEKVRYQVLKLEDVEGQDQTKKASSPKEDKKGNR